MIAFVIPGPAKGKGRPRFNRQTGSAYTPAETASYENLVKTLAMTAMAGATPFLGAVQVELICHFGMPKSTSKKVIAEWHAREVAWPAVRKPDLDNIQKAVTDGMNGVVYKDDAQIAAIKAIKVLVAPGEPELVQVMVHEIKKEQKNETEK